MVQKKTHKGKCKSQAHPKAKDDTELNAQLGALGLRVVRVTADGNCLFRAVADQLEGNEEEHAKYRKMVMDHIEAHREEYEPFLEDDIPFEDYCKNMRETSTWAGHMELQVISLVTHTNICIHRLSFPRWHIQNFRSNEARCIHLSYHNGDHYNSIRRKDDYGGEPAKGIILETPVLEEKVVSKDKAARQKHPSKNGIQKKMEIPLTEEKRVEENGWGSMDDGVEKELHAELIADGEAEEKQQSTASRKENQEALTKMGEDSPSDIPPSEAPSDILPSEKVQKVARNKACPCGSKKKYKSCCGVVKSQNSTKQVERSTGALSNKARKQKLHNSKATTKTEPEIVTSKESVDLGFLCI